MVPDSSPDLLMVYDLRDNSAWRQAHRHRRLWGYRLTNYFVLDHDHIVIEFLPTGDRWEPWEQRRLCRILKGGEAA
jgi:hypothetical protein